jgi:erythromycin esterase
LARLISSLTTMFVVTMLPFAPPVRGGQEPSEPGRTLSALEPGKPVERSLTGGESHGYLVPLKAGQFLHLVVDQRGIDVVVTLLGPDGKRIAEVDSPNGDNGPEPVQVVGTASGDYRLDIRALEKAANRGRYQVKIEEPLSADQYTERLAADKARTEEVKKWLAKAAIRLKGVEAGRGFEDIQPLKQVVGEARLVALGEATHGPREFFQHWLRS